MKHETILKMIENAKDIVPLVKYGTGVHYEPHTLPWFLTDTGFVQYCFASIGCVVPYGIFLQWIHSVSVDETHLSLGDIGFTHPPNHKNNHIGIYIGNGNWMHCSKDHDKIVIEKTSGFKYYRKFTDV